MSNKVLRIRIKWLEEKAFRLTEQIERAFIEIEKLKESIDNKEVR